MILIEMSGEVNQFRRMNWTDFGDWNHPAGNISIWVVYLFFSFLLVLFVREGKLNFGIVCFVWNEFRLNECEFLEELISIVKVRLERNFNEMEELCLFERERERPSQLRNEGRT
ncbi:MAG: hypothetical protein ACTS6G_06085 [Candidatus Hodgkinia cicadicola]